MLPSQARAMITDAGQIVSWDQIQRKVWKDGDAGNRFQKIKWFKDGSKQPPESAVDSWLNQKNMS